MTTRRDPESGTTRVEKPAEALRLWIARGFTVAEDVVYVSLGLLLHPPTMDAAGFVSAARWYLEGFGQRSGISVNLDTPENLDRLPDGVELAMFRVLQEALTNVHRHSEATAANVSIREDAGQVILEIKDNGRGIPENLLALFHSGAATGVGLAGIRERAWELGGKLHIESSNRGTLVRVSIPVLQHPSK